jgi:hypothetical protein
LLRQAIATPQFSATRLKVGGKTAINRLILPAIAPLLPRSLAELSG